MLAVDELPPKVTLLEVSFLFTMTPILSPETSLTPIFTNCNCAVLGKKERSKPRLNPSLGSIPVLAPPRTPNRPSLVRSIPAEVNNAP